MTWFRFTRKGPWHAILRTHIGFSYALCGRDDGGYPHDARDIDPPANEPRCKRCEKAMKGAK